MENKKDVLIIPRHSVFLRFIDVPSVDEGDIRDMAVLQAAKEVPLSREEMVVSHRRLGSFAEGFSSIMLAIAKKETVSKMIEGYSKKGFRAETIRLGTEMLYLLLRRKGVIDGKSVDLVINIGIEHSELFIVDRTRLVFSRGFKNDKRFFEEINNSLLAYGKVKGRPAPENVKVIYAPGADMEYARPVIKNNFAIPVSFYEIREDLVESGLGAEIDLVPLEISNRNRNMRQKKEAVLTYFLSGFTVILSLAFIYFEIYERKESLALISSRVEAVQPEAKRLETYIKKMNVIDIGEREAGVLAGIIKDSYSRVPRDVVLSGFSYDGREKFVYSGTARDMLGVLIFVRELEATGLFETVDVQRATKSTVLGEELVDFNIQGGARI